MTARASIRWVLPAIAAVLTVAVAFVPEPESPVVSGGSSTIAVRQSAWACPVQSGWRVTAGQVRAGDAAQARAIPEDVAVAPVWADAGIWRSAAPGGQALVVEQSGSGSGAVGYVAGTHDDAAVLGSCPPLIDDAWFTGLADEERSAATVTLINLGQTRAVADLTWWGARGPIESLDTAGLVIEAGQRREVSVEAVTAGEGAVAVKVSRRRGALTAVALDAGSGGADLLAPTAQPSRSQVLTGLPPHDRVRLALVNPGTSTAHVSVEVRGPAGAFAAEGLDDVVVEPESVRVVTVPRAVDLTNAALAVTSDHSVAASVSATSGRDIARITAAEALTGPAAAPARQAGSPVRLIVTAGDAAATVMVSSYTARMELLEETQLEIAAGSTVLAPRLRQGRPAYVVVTPADGATVWAGLWQRDGDTIAAAPLRTAPVSVVAPGVAVR